MPKGGYKKAPGGYSPFSWYRKKKARGRMSISSRGIKIPGAGVQTKTSKKKKA